MSKRCRVGVVGCGFFAQNHLQSWNALQSHGADLVAVCDLSRDQAETAAAAFAVPGIYTDMATMIAEQDLDLVDIVTQVKSHKALVTLALDAGLTTVVQKPFGTSLAECKEMQAHAEATGQSLSVHENFRFQHPNVMISDILASGQIGTPTWGRIAFRTGFDVFGGQPYLRDEKRFIVTDVGVHVLDLARVFFGEVDHVSAELQHRTPDAKGEDTATMMLRHTSGAVSMVECTYSAQQAPDPFPATLVEIEGTKGALRLDADLNLTVSNDGRAKTIQATPAMLSWAEQPWHVVQDSVQNACQHFLECWKMGIPASVSAADNVKTYALCDAAYDAAARKCAIRPAY